MSDDDQPPFGPSDAKHDVASDSDYDQSPKLQMGDQEVLERQKTARIMSTRFAYAMGAVTLAFFGLASYFAIKFACNYYEHIHNALDLSSPNTTGIAALLVPIIPATFFSVLGLITLITTSRFVSSFTNESKPTDDGTIITDAIREIVSALKGLKGGE